MNLYTSDGCSYSGMDTETVVRLRTELGRSTEFVTEDEYNIAVAAQQVK